MATMALPGPPGRFLAVLPVLFVVLFPVLFVGPLLTACDAAQAPPERGGLACDEASADFGRVFEGSVLEHEFALDVRGPLAVAAAKTDCGCTMARLQRASGAEREDYELGTPLEAGARLFLGVRYDTRGRGGPAVRAVTLTTGAGQRLALTLTADVQPWLLVEPREFDFVRLLEGQTTEVAFRVRSVPGERFQLRATGRALPDAVRVELVPEDADDSGRALVWLGVVRLGAHAPRGAHTYPIELESDVPIPGPHSAGRRFSLAPEWSLQVLGPVALSTPGLDFGLVQPGETQARTVRLESFDPGFTLSTPTAELVPLHPEDPFPLASTAAVHVREVPGRAAYDIEVVLAGLDAAVTGTFLARLVVATGHPRLPRLEALVRGVRAPGAARGR